MPTSSQIPEYSSAEQRPAPIERTAAASAETPRRRNLEKSLAIHGNAGEGILLRRARQCETVLQPEIAAGMLRRIRHQNQMRVAVGASAARANG